MVENVKLWRASDGTVHDSERDAHLAELSAYLGSLPGLNEGNRLSLRAALDDDPHALHTILSQIVRLTPIHAEPQASVGC